MKKEENIREEIRFSGNVQGVGFRYTAKYAASFYGLSGWVYNDYDGTVLMEVQGRAETIEKMIETIERRPFIFIEQIERKDIPVVSGESGFEIRG